MKKSLLLAPILAILAFSNLNAQLDTTRNRELRVSLYGQTPFAPNINEMLYFRGNLSNISVSYLQRFKKSKYFIKSTVSGRILKTNHPGDRGSIGRSEHNSLNLFLGIEKQYQFKHIGVFGSAGVQGGFANFKGNYDLPDKDPIRNLEFSERYVAIVAGFTGVANITDNLFVYWTTSVQTKYITQEYNQQIDEDCCDAYNGLDFNMILVDAIGIAYKF